MLLAIAPNILHGIEFGRVGGKEFQEDLSFLVRDKLAHQPAAVHGQAVPDDRQAAADVPLEVAQKLDHLRGLDAAGEQTEEEVPDRDASHGRKALPIEGVLQNRRLAAGGPGAHPVRSLAQAALVHKHYGTALLERFFFISGQRTRFQRWMAGSSRCVARPTGRWQLQPRERKIFQTCPG